VWIKVRLLIFRLWMGYILLLIFKPILWSIGLIWSVVFAIMFLPVLEFGMIKSTSFIIRLLLL
jgi:multisubunit Na+/H+ antiporter MnhE subunit